MVGMADEPVFFSLSHKPRPGLQRHKIYGYSRTNALHIGVEQVTTPFVRQAVLCIASARVNFRF
jgi:hypothetical protein